MVYRIHTLQKAGFLHITGRFFVHLLGNPHGIIYNVDGFVYFLSHKAAVRFFVQRDRCPTPCLCRNGLICRKEWNG